MSWRCENVHETPLRPARSAEEYALHLAALEWSLAEAIVIDSPEDIKSRTHWEDKLQPYAHQVQNLFTFCRRLPVSLVADDVGLGKTITAGLILSELMTRRKAARALVLCPKILGPQWVEELDGKFSITAKFVTGAALENEFRRQTPVVITTYDSARDRLDALRPDSFGMLILDEAHKVRNLHGTAEPPRIAVRLREVLEQRLFKYVLMLTATPIHNRLWDLYSLIDCLAVAKGHRNPLGAPEEFQTAFIAPGTGGRKVNPDRQEEFRGLLRQYLVRTRRADARLLFPRREARIFRVTPTAREAALQQLVARYIGGLNQLQQISLAQALMSSPQALAAQMENMASRGKLPLAAAAEARQAANELTETAKLRGLLSLIDQLRTQRPNNWRIVVFTIRKETQQVIGAALKKQGIMFGFIQGGAGRANQTAIQAFRKEPPEIRAIVSTDAGAEGINLQVANVVVNYDLPWNPMIVEQRIGRVQRLASEHAHVIVCNLAVAGSVEEQVVARLMQKLQLISQAIGDIEAILESAGFDGEGDTSTGFEAQIRDLVVQALIGQDVTRATTLAQESFERAKQQLEEQRAEIDDTLGRADELHHSGPTLPKLESVAPSIPFEDFVLRARRAEGAELRPLAPKTFEVALRGRPREVITFDEEVAQAEEQPAVFMGNAPKLYLPGKPAFERLTQQWVDRAGHHVDDLRGQNNALAEKMGRAWCGSVPGAEFDWVEIVKARSAFQGSIVLRAKASNAVDSYERLIVANANPSGHASVASPSDTGNRIANDVIPSDFLPTLKAQAAQAVEADSNIVEFCRFYGERLQQEREKAGSDPHKLHKVDSDFRPSVFAEVTGARGVAYGVCRINVRFFLEKRHPYEIEIDAVPLTGQVLEEPPRRACMATNLVVPEPCLSKCAISGHEVLKHLLCVSEETGRQALIEYATRCPITGKRVFEDEVAASAITGIKAVASLFKASPVSGRLGLTEDFAICEFTHGDVLRDELSTSGVSGRRFRMDQSATSAVSGVMGHRSEFVTCAYSGDAILPAESGVSDVSGRTIRRDLLRASDKAPGRLGAPDEIGVCAVTGKTLLTDELATSAVSGKLCDKDLLVASARSGERALPEEMARCEQSGAVLLPSEVARCALTAKLVDTRLLGQSEVSGAWALDPLLERCAKTGKRALPAELVVCEVTGQRVLPSELETCFVTGQRVLRDQLVRSVVSGGYMLPRVAVRSLVSGSLCGPKEASWCTWLEGPILPTEARACKLSGLTFAERYINRDGEFAVLRALLDGRAPGRDDLSLASWLGQQNPIFRGIKRAVSMDSPGHGVQAVCAEIRTMLGFKVRYVGVLIRVHDDERILGTPVVGRRTDAGWTRMA